MNETLKYNDHEFNLRLLHARLELFRADGRLVIEGDCEIWKGALWDGAPLARFKDLKGYDRAVPVYRMIYALKHGGMEDSKAMVRTCDNDRCCAYDHLTFAVGERHVKSFLTDDIVREIRQLSKDQLSQKEIAARLAEKLGGRMLKSSQISKVVNRDAWSHVA